MTPLPRSFARRFAFAFLGAATWVLGGCASTQPSASQPVLMPGLKAALQGAPDSGVLSATTTASAAPKAAASASAVAQMNNGANSGANKEDTALALQGLPGLTAGRAERRFSVVLNNASPEVVFMALLAETPLSVAVDPSVKGPLSISLKDVTLRESLDLLRELHGLDYKVIGRHILVSAAQLQTRIFTVDYPSFNRQGRSELRVLSGSITGNAAASTPGSAQGNPNTSAGATGGGSSGGGGSMESSRISTAQRNDLWGEIETTVKLLVGEKEGRSVVVSPQTGNIVVRALPREIRAINDYLEATRLSVQRQVMLEAKVVEVQLRDSERTGINWAAFRTGLSTRASGGVLAPGVNLSPQGVIGDGLITVNPGVAIEAAATAAGSLLGLAFQTRNFAAVLDFLGTQGNTQVLSSPRIATMNNQKAVLKVGTDDFFVTSISSTTTAVGNTTATTPNIGVQPFFSGISLDVTPNIDANGYITLHVHPSVSNVSERTKIINLGTQGSYALPLASSEINESDAVVRAHDGHIIAIGGLMRQASSNSDSGVPGTEGTFWRKVFGGQTNRLSEKRELVILLKPTIVDPSQEDAEGRRDALQRLLDWTETQPLKPTKGTPRAQAPVDAGLAGRAEAQAVVARTPTAVAPVMPTIAPAVAPPAPRAVATAAVVINSAPSPGAPPPGASPAPLVLSWAAMALSFGDSTPQPAAADNDKAAPAAAPARASVAPAASWMALAALGKASSAAASRAATPSVSSLAPTSTSPSAPPAGTAVPAAVAAAAPAPAVRPANAKTQSGRSPAIESIPAAAPSAAPPAAPPAAAMTVALAPSSANGGPAPEWPAPSRPPAGPMPAQPWLSSTPARAESAWFRSLNDSRRPSATPLPVSLRLPGAVVQMHLPKTQSLGLPPSQGAPPRPGWA